MASNGHIDFLNSASKMIAKGKDSARKPLPHPIQLNPTHLGKLNVALRRSLDNLDEELCRFEKNFSGNGKTMCWAANYNDVFDQLKEIVSQGRYSTVRFVDSPSNQTFEELGIPSFVEDSKLQLADEAQVQLFFADLLIAESGSIVLLDKDNDYLKALNNSSVNIFFTTIDHVVGSMVYADIYSKAAKNPTLEKANPPFILFSGSQNCKTYLFVVDNSRSELLAHKRQRQILACTNCGRCAEVCPVDNVIGTEPYNNVFSGPSGRVMLPFMETVEGYKHVVYACTMCGLCDSVCPMHLPIREMILASRREFLENKDIDSEMEAMVSKYKKYVTDRGKMNKMAWLKQQVFNHHLSREIKESRKIERFADKSFNQLYQESQKQK